MVLSRTATEYLIGFMLSWAVVGSARMIGFDRDRAFYPVILIVIASYYVLFAVMGASRSMMAIEILVASAFAAFAVIGFRTNLWFVAAVIAHGIMDAFHQSVIADPGVPSWWPGFCLTFDAVAGAWLAIRIVTRSR